MATSLNSNDCFLLQSGSSIFSWHGNQGTFEQQQLASKIAEFLKVGTCGIIYKVFIFLYVISSIIQAELILINIKRNKIDAGICDCEHGMAFYLSVTIALMLRFPFVTQSLN